MKRMMMPVVSAVSVTQRGLRSCQHKLAKRDAARVVPYKSSLPAKALWPISCFNAFPAAAACSVERVNENESFATARDIQNRVGNRVITGD
jgi:hypothetical protein